MEWISVKDKLSEIYDFVIVYAQMQGQGEPCPMAIARFNGKQWELLGDLEVGAWQDIEYGIDIEDISHWMPLPKLPENKQFNSLFNNRLLKE